MITKLLLNVFVGATVMLIAGAVAAWHGDWAVAGLVYAGFVMVAVGAHEMGRPAGR